MENSRTYFLHPSGSFTKPSFMMEDEMGNPVYEGNMTKQSLLGATTFEFINHRTGRSEEHKVGHTITQQQSGAFRPSILDVLSIKSHFKFDGVKIWDHLHEQGIRINSRIATDKLGMVYEVSLKGQPMAVIASAPAKGGKGILTTGVTYHVTTADEDLDLAFLTAFAIARTEQTFYN